ncbi:MAG: hypothetical protein KZQ83_14775 [gamma proteobacterium symbiont of Taylorina sp.]|nr:hypothetical protein [gamma proteobacterium symbiont of Taylorina sp.]
MKYKFDRKSIIYALVLLAIIKLIFFINSPHQQKHRATTSLDSYLGELGVPSIKSVCNKDSDGDGYASCSYNNGIKIISLECDSAFIFNTGSCKSPKNMFNN